MFSDEEVASANRLAFFLHPDNVVAYNVTLDALDKFWLLIKQQERRPTSEAPSKLPLPYNLLLQSSIYLASDEWERDQESDLPRKPYIYKISRDDLIVRYIKLLIWKTMDRKSCYTAIGVGCLLHSYNTTQIHSLAPDVFNEHNLRRNKSRIVAGIEDRFKKYNIISGESKDLHSRPPLKYEERLIQKSLHLLAPLLPNGITHRSYSGDILGSYFGYLSSRTEWERNHILIDPYCGGFQRLVREYNANLLKESENMLLEDPDDKLAIPDFNTDPSDSGPNQRFNPSPLSTNELISLKRSLSQNQHRRDAYRGDKLHVRIDGHEYSLSALANNGFEPLRIHPDSSYIEIIGEDKVGDILLAVFYIPEFDWTNESQRKELFITYEGGQEIACSFSPIRNSSGQVTELALKVGYLDKENKAKEKLVYTDEEARASEVSHHRSPAKRAKNYRPSLWDGVGFSKLLWRLAGASSWILDKPEFVTERTKYSAIGMAILCTAALAAISGGYAVYLALQSSITALAFGIIWGVMILNLDRFILISIGGKEKANSYKRLVLALPRLGLTVLISLIVATPLEMRLFEREIRQQLAKEHLEQLKNVTEKVNEAFPQVPLLKEEIAKLEAEIYEKEKERNTIYRETIMEADGTGGSKKYGYGPILSAKLAGLKKSEAELSLLRAKNERAIAESREKLDEIFNEQKQLASVTMHESNSIGLLAHLTALTQLCKEDNIVRTMSWFLILLLCVITAIPILTQLLSKPDLYDFYIYRMEDEARLKYAQGIDAAAARELEERLEEVTNLVRFKSRVA